jgi:hypothetical protein
MYKKFFSFHLLFLTQETNAPIAQKYFKQFRQSLIEEISLEAQISPLRIPFLELDFGDNAIMANVMILDKERASRESNFDYIMIFISY